MIGSMTLGEGMNLFIAIADIKLKAQPKTLYLKNNHEKEPT